MAVPIPDLLPLLAIKSLVWDRMCPLENHKWLVPRRGTRQDFALDAGEPEGNLHRFPFESHSCLAKALVVVSPAFCLTCIKFVLSLYRKRKHNGNYIQMYIVRRAMLVPRWCQGGQHSLSTDEGGVTRQS